MPIRVRRIISLLLVVCGLALLVRPRAALSHSTGVLINEFMPRPSSATPEWVELFNPNPMLIDVSGWKIEHSSFLTFLVASRLACTPRKEQLWVQCGS